MSYYLSSTLAIAGMVLQLFVLFLLLLKVGDKHGGSPQAAECHDNGHGHH